MTKRAQTAEDGQLENGILIRNPFQGALFCDDFTIGLSDRDAVAVRRSHHHAFHHGLAADERRFFSVFEHGQELNVREKAH